jgi:hypothetical protein
LVLCLTVLISTYAWPSSGVFYYYLLKIPSNAVEVIDEYISSNDSMYNGRIRSSSIIIIYRRNGTGSRI